MMRNTVVFLAQTFEHSRIAEAQATFAADLSGRTLDVESARVSLSTEDRRKSYPFFTAEPLPLYTRGGRRFYTAPMGDLPELGAWSQADALQIRRGGSLMATFYPASLRRTSSDHTEVTLVSVLGLLAQRSHKGGVYTGQITAGALIREICGDIPVYVSPMFEDVLLYGHLPYVSPSGVYGVGTGSAKDNLLQVVFALSADVAAAPDGTLRVESRSASPASVIDRSRIYRTGAAVEELPPVTAVTVLEHQYITGNKEETLFEGVTTAGQIIVFSEPCSDLAATGFSITESGANYAVLSAGSGTLTGRPYVHTTREITRSVSQAAAENVMRVEGATLVSITNSAEVVNRLAAFYACRKYVACDAVVNIEKPGNVVSIYDPIAKQQVDACIEHIAPLTLSNTLKGHLRALVGFTPWQVAPFEDVRELLTGSGTWTAPEDIDPGTELQVVLIGGGQGGKPGGAGSPPRAPSISTYNIDNDNGPWYHTRYTDPESLVGGDGGQPGEPGNGGNIYRFSAIVNPGDSFSFVCGMGGDGALYGTEDPGALGTDTTFGTHSSASGSPFTSGYSDIDGHLYAQVGNTGVPGGKGASYNEPSPSPIVVDGISYTCGQKGSDAEGSKGTYNANYGYFQFNSYGSYGGGAAYKSNGSNGINGRGSFGYTYIGYDSYVSRVTAYSSIGGKGADALKPDAQTNYGQGGTGGNGGGGQGGYGPAIAKNNYSYPATGGQNNVIAYGASEVGAGSAGGDGAPGCVILYYRRPDTE